jgi:hypothetical protein
MANNRTPAKRATKKQSTQSKNQPKQPQQEPRQLTPKSKLDNLKKEAKRWLKALREDDQQAQARLSRAYPDAPVEPRLRHVQHALAREHGFEGWMALKEQLEEQALKHQPEEQATDDKRLRTWLSCMRGIEIAGWKYLRSLLTPRLIAMQCLHLPRSTALISQYSMMKGLKRLTKSTASRPLSSSINRAMCAIAAKVSASRRFV